MTRHQIVETLRLCLAPPLKTLPSRIRTCCMMGQSVAVHASPYSRFSYKSSLILHGQRCRHGTVPQPWSSVETRPRYIYVAMQVGLGTNFSMLIHPGAELTLLAPSEAAFQRLGFNSSVLPVAEMATQMSKTWVLQRPVNVALSTDSDMLALSLLGHNVTFRAAATGTEVIAKGAVASIAQANLPACKSWVHILDGVLGL